MPSARCHKTFADYLVDFLIRNGRAGICDEKVRQGATEPDDDHNKRKYWPRLHHTFRLEHEKFIQSSTRKARHAFLEGNGEEASYRFGVISHFALDALVHSSQPEGRNKEARVLGGLVIGKKLRSPRPRKPSDYLEKHPSGRFDTYVERAFERLFEVVRGHRKKSVPSREEQLERHCNGGLEDLRSSLSEIGLALFAASFPKSCKKNFQQVCESASEKAKACESHIAQERDALREMIDEAVPQLEVAAEALERPINRLISKVEALESFYGKLHHTENALCERFGEQARDAAARLPTTLCRNLALDDRMGQSWRTSTLLMKCAGLKAPTTTHHSDIRRLNDDYRRYRSGEIRSWLDKLESTVARRIEEMAAVASEIQRTRESWQEETACLTMAMELHAEKAREQRRQIKTHIVYVDNKEAAFRKDPWVRIDRDWMDKERAILPSPGESRRDLAGLQREVDDIVQPIEDQLDDADGRLNRLRRDLPRVLEQSIAKLGEESRIQFGRAVHRRMQDEWDTCRPIIEPRLQAAVEGACADEAALVRWVLPLSSVGTLLIAGLCAVLYSPIVATVAFCVVMTGLVWCAIHLHRRCARLAQDRRAVSQVKVRNPRRWLERLEGAPSLGESDAS